MKLTEIFGYNDGDLFNLKTKHIYYNKDRDGYIRVRLLGSEMRAHRIIWQMFNGEIPEGMLIDHIDGDTSNNRIENLRLATRQQNNANSTGEKSSKLPKGVTVNPSGKFRARLTHCGTTYSLGTFKTPELASAAIAKKDLELNKEFSIYNRITHATSK